MARIMISAAFDAMREEEATALEGCSLFFVFILEVITFVDKCTVPPNDNDILKGSTRKNGANCNFY
jgi:hypothetical protein